MKLIVWTDLQGWTRRAWVRDNDPEGEAPRGLPAGPPDLTRLDWEEIARDISNGLAENGLWTWEDVQRTQNGVGGVVRRALTDRIIRLYREETTTGGIENG